MLPIETTEMRALRMAMEETIRSLQQRAVALTKQVDALHTQNKLLSGHVSDLMEIVGRLEAALQTREAA